jgi:hypothetical protein
VNKLLNRAFPHLMTLQDIKDEITQTKAFQKLPAEKQFEILNSPNLEYIFKICSEILYLN